MSTAGLMSQDPLFILVFRNFPKVPGNYSECKPCTGPFSARKASLSLNLGVTQGLHTKNLASFLIHQYERWEAKRKDRFGRILAPVFLPIWVLKDGHRW